MTEGLAVIIISIAILAGAVTLALLQIKDLRRRVDGLALTYGRNGSCPRCAHSPAGGPENCGLDGCPYKPGGVRYAP